MKGLLIQIRRYEKINFVASMIISIFYIIVVFKMRGNMKKSNNLNSKKVRI